MNRNEKVGHTYRASSDDKQPSHDPAPSPTSSTDRGPAAAQGR